MKLFDEGMAEIFAKLRNRASFDAFFRVAPRDNRAAWIYQDNLSVIDCVHRAMPWLRGDCSTPPGTLISEALDPLGDCDLKATHQRMAYARAAVDRGRVDTEVYKFMMASDYLVIEALEEIEKNDLTREARKLLDANYEYQSRAFANGYAQELVRKTLEGKATTYCEVLKRLAGHFRDLEAVRMGTFEALSESDRILFKKVDSQNYNIAVLCRAAKMPPASSTTQAWVLDRWEFYNEHPEALGIDVSRRRVFVRDVWARECEEAMRRGIESEKRFRCILRTAQKAKLRREEQTGGAMTKQ